MHLHAPLNSASKPAWGNGVVSQHQAGKQRHQERWHQVSSGPTPRVIGTGGSLASVSAAVMHPYFSKAFAPEVVQSLNYLLREQGGEKS